MTMTTTILTTTSVYDDDDNEMLVGVDDIVLDDLYAMLAVFLRIIVLDTQLSFRVSTHA